MATPTRSPGFMFFQAGVPSGWATPRTEENSLPAISSTQTQHRPFSAQIIEEPVVFLSFDTPRRDPKGIIFINPEDRAPESFIQG